MAVTYPGAAYRQLVGKSTTVLVPRIINLHTMVGTLAGTESYFTPSGRPYSHFGTSGGGEVRQWQNLAYRAASDLDGNSISISVENEDKSSWFPPWSGSDVPRFTPAQAEAIAQLLKWLCPRFGIPPVLLGDSLPGRVGPSYHRLGINPWRVQGGILYSSAYGKVCPGDRRIAQLANEIMPRVRALLGQTPPPPKPPLQEDVDMYLLFHPGSDQRPGGWWQIGPGKVAIEITENGYGRMAKTDVNDFNGLPSFALNADDCDFIINALNDTPVEPAPN